MLARIVYTLVIFSLILFSLGVFLPSSEAQNPPPWANVVSKNHSSEIQIRRFVNFAGEIRYVASPKDPKSYRQKHKRYTKVYLTKEAMEKDDPTMGFNNSNSFKSSCGPEAALNLFRFYGIEKREKFLNVRRLGQEMGTTNAGTLGPNIVKTTNRYMKRYMTKHYQFHADHSRYGYGYIYFRLFETLLANGNPILVSYQSGPKKFHAALIVGIENVPDKTLDRFQIDKNDIIILANGNKMTWKDFHDRWKKIRLDRIFIARKNVLKAYHKAQRGGGSSLPRDQYPKQIK